jgi:CRP-like cAMP-binding protein
MDHTSELAVCLRRDASLTHEEVQLICSHFDPLALAKEESLLCAGQKFNKLIFVVDGILRIFVVDVDGNEVVKSFLEANSFFEDIDSQEKNVPSVLNVSAVTDCKLLVLSKASKEHLLLKLPRWDYLMKMGAMYAMNEALRKQEFLRMGDATRQYRYFVENYPNLALQVPLKYIASYLHITQSSLSRIRRQGW